jgi:hypothetical protein
MASLLSQWQVYHTAAFQIRIKSQMTTVHDDVWNLGEDSAPTFDAGTCQENATLDGCSLKLEVIY